jgi:uncharacterized protein (TIGR04255 family)
MSAETPRFEPIFPSHAIERCGITMTFREALPQKTFERVMARAKEGLTRKGLQSSAAQPVGFRIDIATGKVGPPAGTPPQTFNLPDRSATLIVGPNSMLWQNTRYVRWAPFIGQFRDIASSMVGAFLESVTLSAVRLEYWDRFNWTGDWTNFDAKRLIRTDAKWIVQGWADWPREWHSHVGWFEPADGLRRLTNINVDVTSQTGKPSILIHSMMQDEPNDDYGHVDSSLLNESFLFDRLEILHRTIKLRLGEIVDDEMKKRISLDAE